jgi:hypothetical protein
VCLCSVLVLVLCRLLQRYENVKAELEQQQSLERVRVDKFSRTRNIGR